MSLAQHKQILGKVYEWLMNIKTIIGDLSNFPYTKTAIDVIPSSYSTQRIKVYLAYRFNHTYRYIDDVLSINDQNSKSYPSALGINDTTDSTTSVSYLD